MRKQPPVDKLFEEVCDERDDTARYAIRLENTITEIVEGRLELTRTPSGWFYRLASNGDLAGPYTTALEAALEAGKT